MTLIFISVSIKDSYSFLEMSNLLEIISKISFALFSPSNSSIMDITFSLILNIYLSSLLFYKRYSNPSAFPFSIKYFLMDRLSPKELTIIESISFIPRILPILPILFVAKISLSVGISDVPK